MIESFAFSEVVRKLANLIRIGKVAEIDGAQVKVQIGRVLTGWLPIISTAGETTAWTPISKGEQVIVFSPYGESAQVFVLRSIHYNNYKAPDDKNVVAINTNKAMEVKSEETGSVSFDKKLTFAVGESTVELSKNNIKINSGCSRIELSKNNLILSAGDAVLAVSGDGISLSLGSSSIDIGSGNIFLNSGSITTNPPVCKCRCDLKNIGVRTM